MVTMTSIANAMPCPRKPLLQNLIRQAAPPSKAILYGTILHSILQAGLLEQDFSLPNTIKTLDRELAKESVRLEIWGAGLELRDVRDEILEKAGKGFELFGQKWVNGEPQVCQSSVCGGEVN